MKKVRSVIGICLLFFFLQCFKTGTKMEIKSTNHIYYVAKNGHDYWSGKLSSPNARGTDGPLLTIGRAAGMMAAGDTCFIRKGIYREMINLPQSGDSMNKIVFTNYDDEKVVVSGCNFVDKQWDKVSESIYKTSFEKRSDKNMIFVDGKLAPEARWPNSSDDLLRPSFGQVDAGTYQSMTDHDLPEDIDLDGAVLQGFFGKEWALQTLVVSSYDPKTKTIFFPEPKRRLNYYGGQLGWDKRYAPRKGNRFYLVGHYDLLDEDGEWFYDEKEKALFVFFQNEPDPSGRKIETKVRNYAIDLSGSSHIEISGLEIFGAGIKSDDKTHHCIIRKVKGSYVDPGIIITGTSNEVNSCEFAFCRKGIVQVEGKDNRIVNNYIHDGNYTGTWDQILSTRGSGHLVSHNTVSRAGGGCISPGGKNMRFQYNEVSEAGLIRHDIGGFYVANNSGDNTVIAYNRVHDIYGVGIYLDNSTSNYTIHHNVIWNCGWEYVLSKPPPPFLNIGAYDAIRLNTPGNFNLVYNNTCHNTWGLGYWGRNFIEDMYGDYVINNIFTGSYHVASQVVSKNNIHAGTDPLLQDPEHYNFRLMATSPAIDKGVSLKSITEGFNGTAPDCGAYEYGKDGWKAGHNFDNIPDPEFKEFETDHMNLIKNGGFEEGFRYWRKNGNNETKIINENSWGIETANTRMQQHAARLENSGNGIRQIVSGLEPGSRYTLSGWLKGSEIGESAEIAVCFSDEKRLSKSINSDKWEFVDLDFTIEPLQDSVTVCISKTSNGSGYVYCDDVGLLKIQADNSKR